HNKGKRIILVFDEASNIADLVWEVAEGALTDEGTEIIWIAFGFEVYLFDCHNNQRGDDYDYQKTKKETCTTANAYQRQDGTFLSGIYQIPR
ncbi:hypothetical protein, partial [Proteus mirabilis]|uniref:hypothetical protein n=1 Tax=Proteus mirabilis TaxID=584 RepID=UPI003D272098